MSSRGSYSSREFKVDYVELACTKCERRGRLLRDKLIAQYGNDIALPDLRVELARASECERAGKAHDPCGCYYPALKPAE